MSNVSERKQAAARQIELAAQTRQIEKADSLQRMGGAIAHLFNNQLSVIPGNLEMMLIHTLGDDALPHQYLVNAMQAARRSSDVSGLLLTLSRPKHLQTGVPGSFGGLSESTAAAPCCDLSSPLCLLPERWPNLTTGNS